MPKLVWDEPGDRQYETGLRKGVLYPGEGYGIYLPGVPWNGLISVNEKSSGGTTTPVYSDNIKYLNLNVMEEFEATLEAFTYPDEFSDCDGSEEIYDGVSIKQQHRKPFGLSYVTTVGNDVSGLEYGYKIHILYGATAAPSERSYATINNDPDAITLSWDISCVPVVIQGLIPFSSIVIDSTRIIESKIKNLEDILYGTDSTYPRIPDVDEIFNIVTNNIKDNTNADLLDSNGSILIDNYK